MAGDDGDDGGGESVMLFGARTVTPNPLAARVSVATSNEI